MRWKKCYSIKLFIRSICFLSRRLLKGFRIKKKQFMAFLLFFFAIFLSFGKKDFAARALLDTFLVSNNLILLFLNGVLIIQNTLTVNWKTTFFAVLINQCQTQWKTVREVVFCNVFVISVKDSEIQFRVSLRKRSLFIKCLLRSRKNLHSGLPINCQFEH